MCENGYLHGAARTETNPTKNPILKGKNENGYIHSAATS